ncbi:54S ribosomal protein L1, mitochondrial [Daldinia childiae]|uniref:54S ribosomal protein L1, mitochondrial n=1 Tax=Daldinia childiae TaxID=326645 RepID=UPI0014472481|nr:54S ribosomal protein L1, mitochondrial [Daldinia childiae]KAF3056265.1 54S ribosomal protein L1, mitochondrial [Daldinia childiae]
MASTSQCIASLARLSLSTSIRPINATIPRFLAPSIVQIRWKSAGTSAMRAREREKEKVKKAKKQQRFKEYKYATPSKEERHSLCDAMRYLRAAEVGRPPSSVTYELALKIRTPKNSPVLRNRIRLPYPVKNDTQIAVICKEGSGAMHDARAGGAVAFGEESLFELIKANPSKLPFNRLICHVDSEPALKKANLGRILGPKGLMPSIKTNTITRSVKSLMHEMVGAENYRERVGAIRMPIGNIQFTPNMLSANVKALVGAVKENISTLEDRVKKDLVEVVLTSTNGPGFSLSGGFNSTDEKVQPAHLSTAM